MRQIVLTLLAATLITACASGGKPAALPPHADASDYLNLDTGDHSISPHFSYVVKGGFFSGRRIVIYHVPDAQESKPREPLGTVGVDNVSIREYSRKSVYAVSDDGKILLYQHSRHLSTPGRLMAKPEGLYEYVHGRGDRMIHADAGIRGGINRLPNDAIRFSITTVKDPLAVPSETLVRTTSGEEYPERLVGGNALHRAVLFGEADKIKELMQSGLNVEEKNSRGFTPLHEAIWSGEQEIVNLLLEGGANVNTSINTQSLDWAPLHEAARFGFNGIIDLLIKKGADINTGNTMGRTPLDIAVEYRQKDTVDYLTARGAKASSASGGIQGRVQDGKYFSPNQKLVFTVYGPSAPQYTRRDMYFAELDRGLLEERDMFSLRGIYYTNLAKMGITKPQTAEERRSALEKSLRSFAIPNIFAPVAPRSELVHQEFVEANGTESLFAVIRMPEMSGAFDVKTGKKFDAYPSILVSLNESYAIVVRTQSNHHDIKKITASGEHDLTTWISISLRQLQKMVGGIELKQ